MTKQQVIRIIVMMIAVIIALLLSCRKVKAVNIKMLLREVYANEKVRCSSSI